MRGYEFTKCRSADGTLATKVVTRLSDGTINKLPYGRGFLWNYEPIFAASNGDLAELLLKLAPQHDAMIVMGEPIPGLDLTKPHRRLSAAAPEQNTLRAVDRAHLVLDLDDIPVPEPLGDGDKLYDAAEHVRDRLLPLAFRGIECVVCASSSTGLKGSSLARLKLFFLLGKPEPLSALKAFTAGAKATGLPVDPAVIQAGQPIYVARPIFRGMTDPVPPSLHAFVLPGIMGDRVELDVHRYDVAVRVIERRVLAAEEEALGDWRSLLEATLGGPSAFFVPLTKVLGLAARCGDSEQNIVAFTRALLAERADPGRLSEYDEGWIKRTLRSFTKRDADQQKRIDNLRSGLFHVPSKDPSDA